MLVYLEEAVAQLVVLLQPMGLHGMRAYYLRVSHRERASRREAKVLGRGRGERRKEKSRKGGRETG